MSIVAIQKMLPTKAYPQKGLPAGAYATDLPPWEYMTQKRLASVIYFSLKRQELTNLSWFVILCNDKSPYFIYLGSSQWVKPDSNVNAIGCGKNAMP